MFFLTYFESILYHSEPSEVPYFSQSKKMKSFYMCSFRTWSKLSSSGPSIWVSFLSEVWSLRSFWNSHGHFRFYFIISEVLWDISSRWRKQRLYKMLGKILTDILPNQWLFLVNSSNLLNKLYTLLRSGSEWHFDQA